MIRINAPAKVNLYLHLTGRRLDSYHLLDSLFAFTALYDVVTITPSDQLSLIVNGPYSAALSAESVEHNLVLCAAKKLSEFCAVKTGAAIALQKNIPIGAGLGGGSSDAAAVLKGLRTLWQVSCDDALLADIGLSLGADVPACLYGKPAVITSIGDVIKPLLLSFQPTPIVFINPNVVLPTSAVFHQFTINTHTFSLPNPLFATAFSQDFFVFQNTLVGYHNDLEPAAFTLEPTIKLILNTLKEIPGAWLARMSGSGPTCFALFDDDQSAARAVVALSALFPGYWIHQSLLCWR